MTDTSNTTTPAAPKAPKAQKGKTKPKASAKVKAKAKTKAKAKKAKAGPREGSKVEALIALLKSAKGATNEEAAKALDFKTAQSVRGTINGPVRKHHKVVVERDEKRGNVYRIK
jgi:outer membrane biosynthesis protein TonB